MAEINLNKDNFQKEVIESSVPVLIDLWATWCGPCQMLSPIIEEIAKEASGRYKVCKVNVDEEPEIAISFGAQSIPMLVVINEGKVVNSAVGYMPKEKVLSLLENLI